MIKKRDHQYLWHPFTQHGLESESLPVISGEGAWLTLEDGARILDASSSWWVNIHGHTHPTIAKAIYDQAQKLEHVLFAGFTHEPAVTLAEMLISAVQERGTQLTRCFYTDNGATSVEAALKIAYQYHRNKGNTSRTRFISLEHAYHGDTLFSMAVSARGSHHHKFSELLPPVDFIPTHSIEPLKKLLHDRPNQHAAIIIEPLIQGVGGMRTYSPQFLFELVQVCKEAGVLVICDEVFTAPYRTGTCFAFEQAKIAPDLLCLGKGLSGGFLTIGVTLATEDIFSAFVSDKVEDAFLHGHSYTANPLACAASIASWKLLHTPETLAAIQRIHQHTKSRIEKLSAHPRVTLPRTLGTIGAINVQNIPSYFSTAIPKIRAYALKQNVSLRPFGPVFYTVPPYCITTPELDHIYDVIESILNNLDTFA